MEAEDDDDDDDDYEEERGYGKSASPPDTPGLETAWQSKLGKQNQVSTVLLMSVEVPAMKLCTQATFALKPSSLQGVYDCVVDLLHTVAEERSDDFLGLDMDSNLRKLETVRKRCIAQVDELVAEVKLVQEWKDKVKRAGDTMNRMRDAYYRELFHLREQVYQKKKADEDKQEFHPTYSLHFDPSEYTMEDQVAKLVSEKTALMKQELETKAKQIEAKNFARLQAVNQQLATVKMVLARKEKFIAQMASKNEADDNEDDSDDDDEIPLSRVERKQRRRHSVGAACAQPGPDETPQIQHSRSLPLPNRRPAPENTEAVPLPNRTPAPENTEAVRAAAKSWFALLGRRFGSVKAAQQQLALKWKMDSMIGLADFTQVTDELGFACADPKTLFLHFSFGKPYVAFSGLLEERHESAPSAQTSIESIALTASAVKRSLGKRSTLPANQLALIAIPEAELEADDKTDKTALQKDKSPKILPKAKARRASLQEAVKKIQSSSAENQSSQPRRGSLPATLTEAPLISASTDAKATMPSSDELLWQDDALQMDAAVDNMDAESVGGFSDNSDSSSKSKSSQASSAQRSGKKRATLGGIVSARRNLKKKTTKKVDRIEIETQTEIAVACDVESAFSGPVNSIHCFTALRADRFTREQGTNAMPYETAFPKITKVSRAVQSMVDARMLDKAKDYLDNEAEYNWNLLAGLSIDHEMDMKRYANQNREAPGGKQLAKLFAEKQAARGKGEKRVFSFSEYGFARLQKTMQDAGSDESSSDEDDHEVAEVNKVKLKTWTGWDQKRNAITAVDVKELVASSRQHSVKASDATNVRSRLSTTVESTEAAVQTERVPALPSVEELLSIAEQGNEAFQEHMQQVIEMAQELEEKLPIVTEQAQKLTTEAAKRGIETEMQMKLQDQMKRLVIATTTSGLSTMSRRISLGLGDAQNESAQKSHDPYAKYRRPKGMRRRTSRSPSRQRSTSRQRNPSKTLCTSEEDDEEDDEEYQEESDYSDDDFVMKRELAITARRKRPEHVEDSAKLIGSKAERRRAAMLAMRNGTAAASEEPAEGTSQIMLTPGWSGIVPTSPKFEARGVPISKEENANAEKEQSAARRPAAQARTPVPFQRRRLSATPQPRRYLSDRAASPPRPATRQAISQESARQPGRRLSAASPQPCKTHNSSGSNVQADSESDPDSLCEEAAANAQLSQQSQQSSTSIQTPQQNPDKAKPLMMAIPDEFSSLRTALKPGYIRPSREYVSLKPSSSFNSDGTKDRTGVSASSPSHRLASDSSFKGARKKSQDEKGLPSLPGAKSEGPSVGQTGLSMGEIAQQAVQIHAATQASSNFSRTVSASSCEDLEPVQRKPASSRSLQPVSARKS
eukprot:TRINITY_DN7071_c0_g1_i4.p1 TRINITY_DN7071_c0_g1~~TRINITY_DN7071_c0_g1_i4.p1  ORF type:complete len:1365 (-),score=275.22 TRINITY_DN7071_c0_g1_i4:119-4213(-)